MPEGIAYFYIRKMKLASKAEEIFENGKRIITFLPTIVFHDVLDSRQWKMIAPSPENLESRKN